MNNLFKFSWQLALFLLPAFIIHAYIQVSQGDQIRNYLLVESYLCNYLMVLLSYGILYFLQKKFASSLGFFFLGGFFLKLFVFFIFFQPEYKADDLIITQEFSAFFIPYAICLTIETKSLVSYLNRA